MGAQQFSKVEPEDVLQFDDVSSQRRITLDNYMSRIFLKSIWKKKKHFSDCIKKDHFEPTKFIMRSKNFVAF